MTTEKMWLMGDDRPGRRKRLGKLKKLTFLAALVIGVAVYGTLITPRLVEITHHDVQLSGLPAELDELRIVQLSDVHVGRFCRAGSVRRLVELCNAQEPDIVVLTGDYINYRASRYLDSSVEELTGLNARLGLFACLGNHDHWEGAAEVKAALESAGFYVLVNANVRVAEGLSIAGVDDMMAGEPDLDKTRHDLPEGDAVVLLSHNPTVLPKVAEDPWLVLAGHSHGGQIGIPFLRPRTTAGLPGIRHFLRFNESIGVRSRGGDPDAVSIHLYPAGWYEEGKARMYVSRGTGTNQAAPVRLNCRPEIAVFTLHSKE